MNFLARLLDVLFPPKDTERVVREIADIDFGRLVSPTLAPSGVTGLLPYRHPAVRAAIIEAKFKRNPKAIRLLSTVLRDYLDTLCEDARPFETVAATLIPIPLGPVRRHERGYNQTEVMATASGYPVDAGMLRRTRDTRPQTTLSRAERIRNMEGAFAVSSPLDPTRTYIVFDDVVTTGATLEAAIRALTEGGATNVLGLTLAH